MSSVTRLNRFATTDGAFTRAGADWIGACLICGGPPRFTESAAPPSEGARTR